MPEPLTTALVAMGLAALAEHARGQPGAIKTWPGEFGLTDAQLWDLVESGQDPLAGMRFDYAVKLDPRRIDAMMQQVVLQAFKEALPAAAAYDGGMRQQLYLVSSDLVRSNFDGRKPVAALVSMQEDTWARALLGSSRLWPGLVWRGISNNWDAIRQSFDEAQQIAQEAKRVARSVQPADGPEWEVLADTFEEMKQALGHLLARELGGPLPAGVLPAPRMELPEPAGAEPEPVLIMPEGYEEDYGGIGIFRVFLKPERRIEDLIETAQTADEKDQEQRFAWLAKSLHKTVVKQREKDPTWLVPAAAIEIMEDAGIDVSSFESDRTIDGLVSQAEGVRQKHQDPEARQKALQPIAVALVKRLQAMDESGADYDVPDEVEEIIEESGIDLDTYMGTERYGEWELDEAWSAMGF